jgi:hypothetical protein
MSSRHKGEPSKFAINRDWPHQVEIIAMLVQAHYEAMHAFAAPPIMAPRGGTSSYRRGFDFIRFAFSDPAVADAFQLRFGGRRLTVNLVKNRQVDDWGPLGPPRNEDWERRHDPATWRKPSSSA